MKIFLITPKITGRYGRPSCPPVGIAYLMSYLRNKGHKVKTIDMRVEPGVDNCIHGIKNFRPDLIGVGFTSCNYKNTYSLIRKIKKRTGVPVVIGGPHVSVARQDVLKECDADYAIYSEGETALSKLASGLNPKDIKSLIWRKNGEVIINPQEDFISDLDSLPFPEYDSFKLEKYADKRIPITTARGCPHLCVYCAVDCVRL